MRMFPAGWCVPAVLGRVCICMYVCMVLAGAPAPLCLSRRGFFIGWFSQKWDHGCMGGDGLLASWGDGLLGSWGHGVMGSSGHGVNRHQRDLSVE